MKYDKQFTKEEFLGLPIHPHAGGIPAKTDFLLGEEVEMGEPVGKSIAGKMARQKEALLLVLEEVTKANTLDLMAEEVYGNQIKVRYWTKVQGKKDGGSYVRECGGHITMKSIVDDIITARKNAPLVIDTTAEANVTFSA